MTIGYIRVSTNKQDLETQKYELLQFAKSNEIHIDEFLEVETSSKKSQALRKIEELKEKLNSDDLLIVTELSRLGRSMLEVINLVLELSEKGVKIHFLKQKELGNFNNPTSKLILTIYAYLAEAERDFISLRTKAGLEKVKSKGKRLGRPLSTYESFYDKDKGKIVKLIEKGLTAKFIWNLLYKNQGKSYSSLTWWLKSRNIKRK